MTRADLDERAAQLRAAGEPFVRARVVLAHRPTSARPGDEAIVRADGSIEGFVGGTCAESTVRAQSLRLLDAPHPLLLRISPDAVPGSPDGGPDAGGGSLTVHNPCLSGGALDIFLDPVVPAPLVRVHGDGPIAAAIAAVAVAAGYRTGPADRTEAGPAATGADAVVVASHGRDETAPLCAALDAGVAYIGLIASRRRGEAVLAEILESRPDLAGRLDRIDTPAGLDLGARTAGEIAVSVLAAVIRSRAAAPPSPRSARINNAGADQLTSNVTGGTGVDDFRRAGLHTAPGDTGADEVAPNVTGGTGVDDVGRAAADDPRARGGTATDPVCRMTVATTAASLPVRAAGRTVWFCGSGCRRAFLAEPARYPES